MKHIAIIILMLVAVISCFAKEESMRYEIIGLTFQSVTRKPMDGVKICLMRSDSTVLDTVESKISNLNGINRSWFKFDGIEEGNYILKLSKIGFETQMSNVMIKKSKEDLVDLPYFFLKPQTKRNDRILNGAVVRATRIKMIHKGDTIVYDADAFNLAKGSMLDALIKELPGVQLKDDGRILINGRQVDELLLNGKDFFRGDRNILMENLPAYMVKNIKVYEHEMPTCFKIGKKPLAMDVLLKREYMIGWLSNMEASGGTKERYLMRLFGLRFSNHSRLSVFGNMNNINDTRRPGSSGDWKPEIIYSGLQKICKMGTDFYVEDMYDQWNFNTSSVVNNIRGNNDTQTNYISFLPTGNMYRTNESQYHTNETQWSTINKFHYGIGGKNRLIKIANIDIDAHTSYRTYHSKSVLEQAEMNVPNDSLGDDGQLHYILTATSASRFFNRFLNRTQARGHEDGYELQTNGHAGMWFPKKSFSFAFNWNYNKQNAKYMEQQYIDYPADGEKQPDYIHRYRETPDKNYILGGNVDYTVFLWKTTIFMQLDYAHQYNSRDRQLFDLQKLEYWGYGDHKKLTDLPSDYDSLQMVIDARNSYFSRTNDDVVKPWLHIEKHINVDKNHQMGFTFEIPLNITSNRLNYRRNIIDTILTRKLIFINPEFKIDCCPNQGNHQEWISYKLRWSSPSLIYRLNIKDDVDPLNITLSNSCLKNTSTHSVIAEYRRNVTKYDDTFTSRLNYQYVCNALAMGFVYDTKTGIRTTQPNNVNGNWDISGQTDYNRDIDKKSLLTLDAHTSYGYLHNVDLTGTTDGLGVERSVVKTWNMGEEASLNYKIGQNKVGLKGKVAWSDITSGRANFQNMNVWDFQYGVTGLWNLPLKLQLSTDLTMFSRRGYELNSMNTNDLVWNARLSRTFLNGNVTCFVDGFDILGNLSNIYRSVNAQGRTETRYNVVPRYVMLHVIYRLNVQPKKKK
jgi:hypothetical protein